MPFPIRRLEKLDEWLGTDPPPSDHERTSVLNLLMNLMRDPDAINSSVVPNMGIVGLPVHVVIAPRTNVAVLFNVMRSPPYADSGIVLVRIETRPLPY